MIDNPFRAKRQVGKRKRKGKAKRKPKSVLDRTPFRSNFRWKQG